MIQGGFESISLPGMRLPRRRSAIAVAVLSALFAPGTSAQGAHSESSCGQVLDYVAPPSDDIRHGYGQLRLRTASGEVSIAFHHTNPSAAASRTEPGAVQRFANVCISGPYVHVVGVTPYVSPYDLRLAATATPTATPGTSPVTSLPSTATAAAAPQATQSESQVGPRTDGVSALLVATMAVFAVLLGALARRRRSA